MNALPLTRLASCLLAGFLVGWSACGGSVRAAEPPDFATEVAPLLATRCLTCHAGDEPQGQLDLSTLAAARKGGESGSALEPGSLAKSALWERVHAGDMPPKSPLPVAEKELLKRWIEAGAAWSIDKLDPLAYSGENRAGYDWWSLQPVMRPAIPTIDGVSAEPIDRYIRAKLAEHELAPSQPADRATLIRRLSFDLLGLPPSPDELRAFVDDPAPDAYDRLVDRLLASPAYGDRWARHWLDVVRYGESNGFERDLPRPDAWHYRDWLIESFNANLPYDEFVRRQLAADVADSENPDSWRAVGFLVAGPHDTVLPVVDRMRQQMRQDELEDLVGTVGQTFLGLTVNCARCHDHKFDPISQQEYYQLAAALAGVNHGEKDIQPPAVRQQLEAWQQDIAWLSSGLKTQTDELRRLWQERHPGREAAVIPSPVASWDFTAGLSEQQGGPPARLHGKAELTPEGVALYGGEDYASTPALGTTLVEKTLEARVRLANIDQRGGGVLSVQTLDGNVFDAIVFGEQESGRWMAGSNGFVRTQSFGGVRDGQAREKFIHVAMVYAADGTVTCYRDGIRYGNPYRSNGPQRFEAGGWQALIGLRHGGPGGNRLLEGTVALARIYNRALSPEEVADLANAGGTTVTEAELLPLLSEKDQQTRRENQTRLRSLREEHAGLTKSGMIKMYTLQTAQPGVMHVLRRGDVSLPGPQVVPAGLQALRNVDPSFGLRPDALEYRRRQELARWISDPRNPLTARVFVNRLWQYHFGAGLVDTPNDFGFSGSRPTHSELLDWLAAELVESGWDIKALHRRMVLSDAYRQESRPRADAVAVDAGNRWVWRMSPRRLEAEAVRDAMLVLAGELNDTLGGPPFLDVNSYFFKGTQFYDPIDVDTADARRRSVYRMWARGGRNPLLDTFDCPDPSTLTPRRSVTTTPLQALSLLNNSFVRRTAERWASHLQQTEPDAPGQIAQAYQAAYGRSPADDEAAAALGFVDQQGLAAFCRAVFNSSEFLYAD
ncbi:DUF1553 domain-containing protein [Planctellipticum variicoloris]|uniref:DUF1553 domain-containing protein n=1 Tax=Planctellipticum variicoloris TaxID=3064265 RepID=UPI003013F4D1|nr:DUF1553 domain-containing protein [Planctomycetaceae bacterium SH412]